MCTHIQAFGEVVTMFYCDITVDLLLQLMIKCYYISGNVFHFLKMQILLKWLQPIGCVASKLFFLSFTDWTLCTDFQESRRFLYPGLYRLFTKLYIFVYSIHFMDNINLLTKRYTFAFSISIYLLYK